VRAWEAATDEAMQQWARQDRAVEQLRARLAFRGPEARGFVQDWLLLLPLPLAPGEDSAEGLDREQLPGEAMLRPRVGERISVTDRELHWREHHAPEQMLDFNDVLGSVTPSSVAYAVCYLESERAREGPGNRRKGNCDAFGRGGRRGVDLRRFKRHEESLASRGRQYSAQFPILTACSRIRKASEKKSACCS
jgi:hypothetical protein